MNERRAELIRKAIRGSLTPEEQSEYERLQRLSLDTVRRAFPQPPPDFEGLARLRAELRGTSAAGEE